MGFGGVGAGGEGWVRKEGNDRSLRYSVGELEEALSGLEEGPAVHFGIDDALDVRIQPFGQFKWRPQARGDGC